MISFLQKWYLAQCNGLWEQSLGVTIETLAAPGWRIAIDLAGTDLEQKPMEPYTARRSTRDWVECKIEHNQFIGAGDPLKLGFILHAFEQWASGAQIAPSS